MAFSNFCSKSPNAKWAFSVQPRDLDGSMLEIEKAYSRLTSFYGFRVWGLVSLTSNMQGKRDMLRSPWL